jgi:26S proteasome regulatory subunit N2
MAVGGNLTSAAGILSLLEESELEVKVFALQRLNQLVDRFWAEIADCVSKFEELYEDETFPERELSALVASKVYYHLGSFKDSLTFALGAGPKFDVNGTSEYIETILSQCIDHYTQLRVKHFEEERSSTVDDEDSMATDTRVEMIDTRLESIVNRMFERCLSDRRYKQAIGIAFETRRVDILQRAIHESGDIPGMLSYCLRVALSLISNPAFRNTVLKVIVRAYKELDVPDYISVCQCYIFLDEPNCVAQILQRLVCSEVR